MITLPVELYTDGSCLRNPGIGGYAYIIRTWEKDEKSGENIANETEFKQGYRLTTNNRMEMMAVIRGLSFITTLKDNDENWKGVTQINIFSDSEYVCNPINQRWVYKWQENNWMTSGYQNKPPTPVRNKDLWTLILEHMEVARNLGMTITFTHVKGHNGNEMNERCDKLAYSTLSGTEFLIDEEYEKSTNVLNRR